MSDLARRFHDTYERLAPHYGYTTRTDTREFDPDSSNGRLMAAVCSEVFGALEAEVERLRARVTELEGMRRWEYIESLEARVAELGAELMGTTASLAAAISLLERGGKAVKKAAASDKMLDIMLNDYREALEAARAALAAEKGETT